LNYSYEKLRETSVVSEAVRKSMAHNRSTGTAPEEKVRKALWHAGIRGYRKNAKKLPGKPDIFFGKAKLAVFVHGCYWHQCPHCTNKRIPKTNALYWETKFRLNVERDARNEEALISKGYGVLVVWECEVKASVEGVVERIRAALNRTGKALEPPT